MALSEGAVLGGYVVERRLAIGGMAEVWLASRRGDVSGQRYALKVLIDVFARDPKLRAMFQDEVAITRRLDHPNVVRVEGLIEEAGVMAQVMERVEGRDLRRVLQGVLDVGAQVPVAAATFIGREVARGLAHAHAARGIDGGLLGLVHRDVSPHNVMIDRRGRVVVLDFGVARARERATVTSRGTIKGKLSYMAPEQMLGREVTTAADVWSLGVVLWETLALRRLFGASSDVDLVHEVTAGQVAALGPLRPDAPPRLVELVMRMLSVDPAARPASMAAVEKTLAEIGGGLGEAFSAGALAAWAGPFLEPSARKTGVIAAPRLTALARPATATMAFHDPGRDEDEDADAGGGEDLADTAPPDLARDVDLAPTEGVMLPSTRPRAVSLGAAPTEGPWDGPQTTQATSRPGLGDTAEPTIAAPITERDLGPIHPVGGAHGGGRDVPLQGSLLDSGEMVAPTRTPISPLRNPSDHETVRPSGPRAPVRAGPAPTVTTLPRSPALAAATVPMYPRGPTPEGPAPHAPPAVPPQPYRFVVWWVTGGLVLGIAATLALSRACA